MNYNSKLLKYTTKFINFDSQMGGTNIDKTQLQTFIESASVLELVKPNRLVLIKNTYELKKLSKSVKSDDRMSGASLSHGPHVATLCLVDPTYTIFDKDKVLSFINFQTATHPSYGTYIHINYSFTYVKYRGKGYNPLLRQIVELIAKNINICRLMSVPLEGASSVIVLKKMGYVEDGPFYYKIVC